MKSHLTIRTNRKCHFTLILLIFIGQIHVAYSHDYLFLSTSITQQSIIVSGTIISASDGESLPGVNVLIKGTSVGTVSGVDGQFTIEVPSKQSVLVFSFIGFETLERVVGEEALINISLTPSMTSLHEVVVVGYGTQEKISVTNSVGTLGSEELVRRPVTSLQQAMQGTVPGLMVLDYGGSPGSPNQQIVIRGVNTIYKPPGQLGSNQPLVIIDGIEQPLQNINPADIESISVLKDASSAAIYGSRASNGVVLVTTKRAKVGKVSVSYSGFYAVQTPTNKPKHMDIESYMRLQNVARQNVGSPPIYTEEQIQTYTAGTKNNPLKYPLPYDWHNVMYKDAPQVNHALAISGGTAVTRARLSIRSQDQGGIIANTNAKITEVRLNSDFTISPKITIAADMNFRNQSALEPNNISEVFRLLLQNSIWAVPKYPNGNYGGGNQGNNPLLLAETGGTNKTLTNYYTGSLTGGWEILKGLKFSTQIAFRINNVTGKNYVNTWEMRDSTVVKSSNLINQLTETRTNMSEVTINSLLNYDLSIRNFDIRILGGYSQIRNKLSTLSASRQSFYSNDVTSIGQGANDQTKDNGGGDSEWALRSYFARANFAYKDKYLVEVNARYDGSSRFTGNNQYGFFPSFSAGWRLSEEKFLRPLTQYFTDLKLRGSWGRTGNNTNVPLYSYYPQMSLVTYSFNNTAAQGYEQRQAADPSVTWETTEQTDFGLDAVFLNGQFSLTIDYYKKTNRGILLALPVPGVLGLQAGTKNAGVVQNKGWEFQAGSNHHWGNINFRTNLNFSIDTNEVINLAGTGPYIAGDDIDPRYIIGEGYPMNGFWGYKTGGLFQTANDASSYPQFVRPAKPGDVKVLDLNGDEVITPSDMTYLANSIPKYTFGGAVNFAYKAFSLNINLQGAAGFSMRVARALGEQGNYEGFTPDIYTNNYWTPENTGARFPRPTKLDLRNQASTDRMLIDASYLKIKNIQLVYRLPKDAISKTFLYNASLYVSWTNGLTFSKMNEWHLDPESTSGWQNYYPQTALYTVGVNLQY